MAQHSRPDPFLVGEHPALDFLNSVATPRAQCFDWLETGADLLDWMIAAGLVHDAEVALMREAGAGDALEEARAQIIAFRERLRAFVESMAGRTLEATDHPIIAEINALLLRGPRIMQIRPRAPFDTPATGSLCLIDTHPLSGPQDLIIRLAIAAARLITEANFRYIRNCEGPSCTLYFLDISKNHKRRWCTMDVCGNRAKAAAFRRR